MASRSCRLSSAAGQILSSVRRHPEPANAVALCRHRRPSQHPAYGRRGGRCCRARPRSAAEPSRAARSDASRNWSSFWPAGSARPNRRSTTRWSRSLPQWFVWPDGRSGLSARSDRADGRELHCRRRRHGRMLALHELNLRVFELALELPTGDITQGPAMDDACAPRPWPMAWRRSRESPDLLCMGDMGIGNTTVAAAIYAALYGGSGADWVGRGTRGRRRAGAQGRCGRSRRGAAPGFPHRATGDPRAHWRPRDRRDVGGAHRRAPAEHTGHRRRLCGGSAQRRSLTPSTPPPSITASSATCRRKVLMAKC